MGDKTLVAATAPASPSVTENVPEDMVLNYHLMHPGGNSEPGDPNAAFYRDGVYHLHYIIAHPWNGKTSFSFVHLTSPGHAALGLAEDDFAALLHRPRDVQRHRFYH
jgi:hypothetical protein